MSASKRELRTQYLRLIAARIAAVILILLSTVIFADGVIMEFGQIFYVAIDLIYFVVFSTVALIIITRKSDNYMVLAVSAALVLYGTTVTTGFARISSVLPTACSGPGILCVGPLDYWSLTINFLLSASTVSVPILAYLFPDGNFIPHWTRWVAGLWVAWGFLSLFIPHLNPYNWPFQYLALLYVFGLSTGIYAQVVRYRTVSTQEQRQQTKWVAFGFAAAGICFSILVALVISIASFFPSLVTYSFTEIFSAAFLVSQSVVPICIGLSILRRRLWDIDVIINRTLIYTLLSGCLFLLFWVGDKVLEELVGSVLVALTEFSSLSRYSSQFSGVGSALIVGKSVSPIHKRSEDFINRMFYKDKIHLRRQLSEFAHEIRNLKNLSQILNEVVERTCELLKIRCGAVYLSDPSGQLKLAKALNLPSKPTHLPKDKTSLGHLMDGTPVFRSDDKVLPLILPLTLPSSVSGESESSRLVGLFALGPRESGMGYSNEDQSMLQELADEVAPAIYFARKKKRRIKKLI